jgi:hypothetical protein
LAALERHRGRAGRFADQFLEHGPSGEHELAAELFEEFGAFAVAAALPLDQPLLGGGEHAFEVDEEPVFNQMGVDVAGATAHELLLKPRDGVADGRLDLALRLD